jgi:hypothetical protein
MHNRTNLLANGSNVNEFIAEADKIEAKVSRRL